jgi:hypothetical protein
MQLELGDDSFVLFRTLSQNRLNLVYTRSDKNIGWLELEPDEGTSKSASA